jgi:hypothetical protein
MWRGQISLSELPGECVSPGTGSTEFDGIDGGIEIRNGLYVMDDFRGFGADRVADKQTKNQVKAEIARLESLRDAGDDVQVELHALTLGYKDFFIPGGRMKQLNPDGLKTADAARKRKSRAIAALRDAGLIQIAEHFRDYYQIQSRTWSYCPASRPHWLIGASTSSLYEARFDHGIITRGTSPSGGASRSELGKAAGGRIGH